MWYNEIRGRYRMTGECAKKLKEIKDANKKEWKNMPEYKFIPQKPIRTIRINFETIEDLEEFKKVIGQKIYPTRNTYWYPERHDSLFSNLVYIDEKDEDKEELKNE
jgi:hypothetical protein